MLAQALEVSDLEAAPLDRRDHVAELVELAVGEDVPIDEAVAPEASSAGVRRAADPVVQQAAARTQEPPQPAEVHAELR